MPAVFVGPDRIRVNVGPLDALASGGEANIYKWKGGSNGDLLKLLKTNPPLVGLFMRYVSCPS